MAEYDEYGGEIVGSDKEELDEYGGVIVKAPAPAEAAQASLRQAFNTPEPTPVEPERSFGERALRKGFAVASGLSDVVPYAPQIIARLRTLKGPETYEEELKRVREEKGMIEAGEPVTTGAARAGGTIAALPALFAAAPAVAAAVPFLGPAALPAATSFLGGLYGGMKVHERKDATAGDIAKGAAFGAAVPAMFKGASTAARFLAPTTTTGTLGTLGLRTAQTGVRAVPYGVMAEQPVTTLLSDQATPAEKTEAAINLLALPAAATQELRQGTRRAALRQSEAIAERARPEAEALVAAEQEAAGETAMREQTAKEARTAIAERQEANRRAKRELAFEQSIDVAADKLKGGAQKALGVVQSELAAQQQLIQALENATDPSLLGWRAKQFQDMANRLNSYEASWSREYFGQPLPQEFYDIRSKLDQSLMRNTQLMGSTATESFLADPDRKFAEYQARKVAEGRTKEADLLQRLNTALQFANKDFSAEARAQAAARKPPLSDARRAAIYAKHGLADPGPTPPFATPPLAERQVDVALGRAEPTPTRLQDLVALLEQEGLPSGMTREQVLAQAGVSPADAARIFAERKAAAERGLEFGTPKPGAKALQRMDLDSATRAVYEMMKPEWLRGGVLARVPGLRVGGLAPGSQAPQYLGERIAEDPTQTRFGLPFQAFAMADRFTKVLQRNASVRSRYDQFVRAAAKRGRGEDLKGFIQDVASFIANDPEAAEEMRNAEAAATGAAP